MPVSQTRVESLPHAIFLQRVSGNASPTSLEARLGQGAFLALRLVDLLAPGREPVSPDAFHYQCVATDRFCRELRGTSPEGAHVHGTTASAADAYRLGDVRQVVPALLAYAHFLEDELRLEEALDVLATLLEVGGDRLAASDAVGARRPLLGAVEPDRAREHGAGAGQPGRGGAQSAGDPRGSPCRGPPRRGGTRRARYRGDVVLPGPARPSGTPLLACVRALRRRGCAAACAHRRWRHAPHSWRCCRSGARPDGGRSARRHTRRRQQCDDRADALRVLPRGPGRVRSLARTLRSTARGHAPEHPGGFLRQARDRTGTVPAIPAGRGSDGRSAAGGERRRPARIRVPDRAHKERTPRLRKGAPSRAFHTRGARVRYCRATRGVGLASPARRLNAVSGRYCCS